MKILAPSLLIYVGVYVMSFFFALSYSDWFLVWGGLEMNMMGFLGMSCYRGNEDCLESLYSYFFVQSVASGLFLMMVVVGGLVSLALMVKLAAGPFFFWLPAVMSGMSWAFNFVLMTAQKFLPLVLVEGVGGSEVVFFGLISLLVGVAGSMNQVDMRSLMAYSSVNHVGWMILSQFCGDGEWLLYLGIYVVVMGVLVFFLWLKGLSKVGEGGSWDLSVMFILMLNMGGMPPMLGFVMSWVVLQVVVMVDYLVSAVMVLSSLGMLYVYLRMFYDGMFGGGQWVVWMSSSTKESLLVVLMMLISLVFPFVVWLVI